jgi:hypothetical protein
MKKLLVIAFGCEIRDALPHKGVVDFLNANATLKSTDVWEFKDTKKKLEFEIRVVYTKAEFQTAMDTKDAIVVYDGHSRFGQGPAFGPAGLPRCPDATTYPMNPWENHFRMGYDVQITPCIEDIFEHCTNPTEFSKTIVSEDLFATHNVKKILRVAKERLEKCKQKGFARRELLKCFPSVANQTNGRGVQSLKSRHYWHTNRTETDFMTIVEVGSADLSTVGLKCSVLFMNSCSSKPHFYKALRQRKKETKSKCVFYMTNAACSAATTVIFIKQILKGRNPTSRRAAKKILKEMNAEPDAGAIMLLT